MNSVLKLNCTRVVGGYLVGEVIGPQQHELIEMELIVAGDDRLFFLKNESELYSCGESMFNDAIIAIEKTNR